MSINDYLIKTKFAAISRRVWVLNEPENELECGGVMSIRGLFNPKRNNITADSRIR